MAREADSAAVLVLPTSVTGRSDISRLGRELEAISGVIDQAALRKSKEQPEPPVSQSLEELAEVNKLKIQDSQDRQKLAALIKQLSKDAPSIHISLAAEPSPEFTAKLVSWLRQQINPQILLEIGLQPTIAAGCIIRTNSKYFDCSMRQHLVSHKEKLVERLKVGV